LQLSSVVEAASLLIRVPFGLLLLLLVSPLLLAPTSAAAAAFAAAGAGLSLRLS
jgi:hypothetical protein